MTAGTASSPAAEPTGQPRAEDASKLAVSSDRLRLRYLLAAAYAHSALTSTRGRRPALQLAVLHAQKAIADAESLKQLIAAEDKPSDSVGKRSRARQLLPGKTRRTETAGIRPTERDRFFLSDVFIPTAEVLLAGVGVELLPRDQQRYRSDDLSPRLKEHVDKVEPIQTAACADPGKGYRVLYNVACFWSELHGHQAPDDPDEARPAGRVGDGLDARALVVLRSGLSAAPRDEQRKLAAWARSDPSLRALRRSALAADVNATLDLYAPISPKPAGP